MPTKIKPIYWILGLALLVRLVFVNQSFWLDEAIGAIAIKEFSFKQLISHFPLSDNHPPLYYLTLKLWSSIFGFSELAIRSLSIFFGVGTVWLTYGIAKHYYKRKAALISSVLITTSQIHIFYSQEARMYMMITFLAALSFYFLIKEKWPGFALALVALSFTDYVSVFMLPVYWLYGFFEKKKVSWWTRFVSSHIPLVIIGILWLPIFVVQSQKGGWLLSTLPAWRDIAGGATIKELILVWTKYVFGRISFLNKYIYALVIAFSSLPFVYTSLKLAKRKKVNIFMVWLVVPLVLGFVASFSFPAFTYFRFIYVLPALYILVASMIVTSSWKKQIMTYILVFNIFAIGIYWANVGGRQQREDWKGAVNYIENTIRENEKVLFDYPEPFAPWRWYSSTPAVGVADSISSSEKTTEITRSNTEGVAGVYYFEYLQKLTDPNDYVRDTLIDKGFAKDGTKNFYGVGLIEHWTR